MATKSQQLAARRAELVALCAEQRFLVAEDIARLRSAESLGVIPAYVAQHKRTALIAAGLAAGFLATRPAWAVGIVTAGVSAYKFARKTLPVLGWKGFEVH